MQDGMAKFLVLLAHHHCPWLLVLLALWSVGREYGFTNRWRADASKG